jgi:Flp pilus assembly protein CpaB
MNMKALIPLAAGLGIGGVALVLGINTLKSARAAQQPVAKVKIWAAREDIPRGAELKEEMLTEVAYAADALPKGAFKKKEDLIGRVPRLVAPEGLPILETMLSSPGTKSGISVKPGYRAVAVKIDAGSGVDFHLEPGSFVDVVGSFKVNRNGKSETIARTIVENVEVAAVGQRVSPTSGHEGDKKEKEKDRSQTVRAVTLFVQPEDVPKLLLTEQQGRIKLSMRGNADQSSSHTNRWASEAELTGEPTPSQAEPETAQAPETPLDWLRGLFAKPAAESSRVAAVVPPRAPPPARWILKIYRGNKEEIVQFKGPDSCERVDDTDVSADTRRGGSRPEATHPAPRSEPSPTPDSSAASDQGDHAEPQELSE